MAKKFWTWLKGLCRKLGKTDYDLEEWYRLEFKDHRQAPPKNRESA